MSSQETEKRSELTSSADCTPGLNSCNFLRIASQGFGDPQNCYPHGMTWYDGNLFVGTTRANLANRAKQIASNTPERLGEIWPVPIPESHFDNDLRAEIWRFNPRQEKWKRVYSAPLVKGVDGFDVPISVGFRCMTPFKGRNDSEPALYTPTWGSHQTPGTLMLRSTDGDSFEVASEPGLGIKDNAPRSLRGIVPFNGYLFTSPVVGQKRLEPNIAGAAIVYCSSEPNGGEWELACEPHFGNKNNVSVFHMAEFNNHLYAGTLNIAEGFELWKTEAKGKPPFKWKKVIGGGAFRGKLNQMAMTLIAFKDHLYVGSAIQNCSWDFDYQVGPAPPEIIRVSPDDSWELIFGEPRITPDGLKVPLSGIGPGFGNPFSGYIWAMCVHQGWLYISTAVWAVFLRYAGRRDRWPKHMQSVFSKENLEKILHNYGGCDLWRSRDGRRWLPVTVNGFGNVFNIGFRNMVSSPYGLFVGAANPFSPDVAVSRLTGWNYEHNSRGGLEIWYGRDGTFNGLGETLSHPPKEIREMRDRLLAEEISPENGEDILQLTDELYEESCYIHTGLWRIGITRPREACDNLMGEIAALVDNRKAERILDMSCGCGASTNFLAQLFSTDSVVGITHDEEQLKRAQAVFPKVNVIMDGRQKLSFKGEEFDVVVWARDLLGKYDSRKLHNELYKVVKKGGQVVGFDWIPQSKKQISLFAEGEESTQVTEPYEQLLRSVGYEAVQAFNVTEVTRGPFKKYISKYFRLRAASGIIDETVAEQVENHLLEQNGPGSVCFIYSAIKP